MRFATFPLHLSKVLRLPGKSDAKSYKVLIVLHLLRKLDDLMLQNATPLRNDLRTALMNMSLVLRVPCEIKLFSSSSNAPPLPSFLDMLQNPHVLLPFYEVHNLLRWPLETTPERPKAVRTCGAFNISTWNCASRHNGVHFFDISTSKSAPNLACFVHFDLEMCFVPTTAYTCSTSQLPKVLRDSGVLYLFTWKFASRHNSVQLFISHLARWLRTRRFSEPTFRPSGATNHWKNTVFRHFATFSRTCIFFPLTLSLLWSSFFLSSLLWLFPPLSICP